MGGTWCTLGMFSELADRMKELDRPYDKLGLSGASVHLLKGYLLQCVNKP